MIQSNVYVKSSPSWIGSISWIKIKIGISKNDYGLYYILFEPNVNTIESLKLGNYLTTKH